MSQKRSPNTPARRPRPVAVADLLPLIEALNGAGKALAAGSLTPEQSEAVRLVRETAARLCELTAFPSPGEEEGRIISREALASLREELGEALDELIVLFGRTSRDTLAEMQAALAEGSIPRLGASAHRLKGSALNFGADRMVAACQSLESAASEPEVEIATLAPLLDAVVAQYRLVSRELGI